jgi:twinkle protein
MQKIRTADKDFIQLGDKKNPPLFGQHICRDAGKMVVVTEGELDAMAAAQAMSPKLTWPAVSVPNGAQSAKKHLANHLEWLCRFEKVILAFDMDEPGRKAAEECAALFPPGKAFIAQLPAKDACEALQEGKYKELVDSFWGAKAWRPDGIVSVNEIVDDVLTDPQHGAPFPWASLTDATYGRHPGELLTIGAGTGVGKTDVLTQMVAYDLNELHLKCGVIFLEQSPRQTVRRLAGKIDGKRYHLPQDEEGWDSEQLEKTVRSIGDRGTLFLYNHFGSMDWENIKAKIRYMVLSLGAQHIYLDHLTAMAAAEENEKEALEHIMAEVAGLSQELQVVFHLVSHLTTPEGTPHEEGGRVKIRHFKGSRSIGFWSHNMIGLERNQQAEDEDERFTTTVRILKWRENGEVVGQTIPIKYQPSTGLLLESDGIGAFDDETGF